MYGETQAKKLVKNNIRANILTNKAKTTTKVFVLPVSR